MSTKQIGIGVVVILIIIGVAYGVLGTDTEVMDVDETMMEDDMMKDPMMEDDMMKDPMMEDDMMKDPMMEDDMMKDPMMEDDMMKDPMMEDDMMKDPMMEDDMMKDPMMEDDMMKDPMMEDDMMKDPMMEETAGLSGEVTIGAIVPLTGDWSTHGLGSNEGSKFGVSEFNKHLQDIDAPWHLKMITEDSATNPVTALEKLTSLYAKGIGIVIGPETSSNVSHMKGYSDSNNMLLVSCCSTAPALAITNDSVFRLIPDDSKQGPALAKLMKHEGIDVLVPVYRGDTWGDGLSKSTTDSFIKRGGIVGEPIRYNPETPEFSVSVSLLAQQVQEHVDEYGADKVGVMFLGFAEILQFTQSASEYDILHDVRWFGPGATTKDHSLIDDPIALEFSTNVQFTSVAFAITENPKYNKVQSHITEVLGMVPNVFVHSSYDAVWLIGLAMLETQSSDVSVIKAALPGIAENYIGAIGPTTLNEAGDLAQANYNVWGIRGGEWLN